MAENANEISMPAFMRAGLDFFSGKTVLKATLDDALSRLATAEARIKELEAAAIDPKPLNERIAALEGDVKAKEATIKALEENAQTAARQAQQMISQAGAQTPANVSNKDDSMPKANDFREKFRAKVKSGTPRGTALAECMKEFPNEYAEAKRSGGLSNL